jgi:hypothetical protein|tara:strand:- start:86 stop:337 length:252 start_codon:yes stop_codon:yes gene_type:complete
MSKKSKGRKWDGKSRVSTDLYRKRWDEIFKERVMEGKDPFVKEQEELKESYEQSKRAKKEREANTTDSWVKGYWKWKKENEKE